MPTAHIRAERGDIAPAVILPGDPRRAERMAHALMPDARLVTDVRGMLGFTGTHEGKPLSVMGSGMGMPSATIYATELYREYGVQRIVRVGTAGGIAPQVQIGDVVVATGAHTDSGMNQQRLPGYFFSAIASFDLARAAVEAHDQRCALHVGTIVSKDHFYLERSADDVQRLGSYGVLAVEMEAAALYGCAAEFSAEALAVLTVSNHLLRPQVEMDSQQREQHFGDALRLAVAAALH
ncbi:purine-nucleoside phosphorylase [Gephyromycinifex aptenodytis]|uniref:purine-nucleoside phosphorylase n=1 Tax=Gephyromycinifex aptenodytis TaxID=2716227 RepID=UPI001445F134|nr:purine-nucleoside phosphorylase [Gephyromycinifex aptenodytis]